MSKGNPALAIKALTPEPIAIEGTDIAIQPITLGIFAALERIESPIITGAPITPASMLPTYYLLAHGAQVATCPNLVAESFQWADTLPLASLRALQEAALKQLSAITELLALEPSDPATKKKERPATTAGS